MEGDNVYQVGTPCFVIDRSKVEANCRRMQESCQKLGIKLRPMTKTHKCIEAAVLSTDGKKHRITVSTLAEAEFYAGAGFDDILYASIFTDNKMKRLCDLQQRLNFFHVLIDSDYAADLLQKNIHPTRPWSVFLKVDVGYKRAGIHHASDRLTKLALRVSNSDWATLRGLYCHEGHSYDCQGHQEVGSVWDQTVTNLDNTAERLRAAGAKLDEVTMGATPSASLPGTNVKGLTEIHPGNFVFYDMEHVMIGACQPDDIAGRVVTRVIGHYPENQQILIDAGFLALSHDGKGMMPHGGSHCVVEGAAELVLKKLSQEVGILAPQPGETLDFKKYPVGSVLFLLPFHACATAAMHRKYLVLDKNQNVSEIWTNVDGW